jgi:hypothetical protein
MSNMNRPERPGYYWWRVDSSFEWEPVQIIENTDGDLWVRFIGHNRKSHISAVSGEWFGNTQLKPAAAF